MAPAVGGVAHDSVNTHPRAERARTAHRQKKEPQPLTSSYRPGSVWRIFVFCFSRRGSEKKHVCPVVKKRSRQISKCTFLFEQSYMVNPLLEKRGEERGEVYIKGGNDTEIPKIQQIWYQQNTNTKKTLVTPWYNSVTLQYNKSHVEKEF